MGIIIEIVTWFLLKIAEAIPGKLLDWLLELFGKKRQKTAETISPYPSDCGDRAIDLGYRKPYVSDSFGAYFAGLLEDTFSFLTIEAQLEVPSTSETASLAPTARILYEFRKPTGFRLVVIAADGGMGKTSLAAKMVKCLYEQNDADFILGDSAKVEHFDPVTNSFVKFDPTFQDARTFYRRLYAQIGLPPPAPNSSSARMVTKLKEQLRDFRAVIVIDNLDSVEKPNALLKTLKPLLGREVRAVVTTREVDQVMTNDNVMLVVHLRPLTDVDTAQSFLRWHVQHYQPQRPRLRDIAGGLDDKKNIKRIIEKTGGVPLIMQLVMNDVETRSWDFLKRLPNIQLSSELLDYLYKQRWEELASLGVTGEAAIRTVTHIAAQQMKGKRISTADLMKWGEATGISEFLFSGLEELDARFLVLNRDQEKGNYSVFPSFTDFIQRETSR